METTESTGAASASTDTSGAQSSSTELKSTGSVDAGGTGTSVSTGSEKSDGAATASAQGTTPEVDAWKPNYKFKANDKELEFDDLIKPLIKTKEHEAKLKELYEKSHGLDEVKTSRKVAQDKLKDIEGKYNQVEQSLATLGQYVKKGDMKSFFDTLKIPKDAVIRYAIEELKYQELPPEQKAAIDAQRQQQMSLQTFEQQNQTLHQQMQAMMLQQATNELTLELSKPNVSQAAAAFNARVGKPDAFKSEIIRRGQFYETVHGISPPVGQLVDEILALVGGNGATTPVTQSVPGAQGNAIVSPNDKPAIPSFKGGSGKSPAKKVPTSIDDLRNMRKQLNAQNN